MNSTGAAGRDLTYERRTYEDPFLDMASTMLPKNYRKLQELCQIFATQHPQIAPVIYRLAEYPITNIVYTGEEEAVRQNREVFDNDLQILDRGLEWGLDFFGYGNTFVTVSFPFERYYDCNTCKTRTPASRAKVFVRGNKMLGRCLKCNDDRVEMKPVDVYIRRSKGINIVRLEPTLMTPKENRISGVKFYYYDIPADIRTAVMENDRDIIDTTPVAHLECIFKRTKLKLKSDRVFHFKRPTISGRDSQWGLPLIMPVLKDAYLNQIYKKSDEMIASEHAVPLRIMFPEPTSQDPLRMTNMGAFKTFMGRGIDAWRKDKNTILTAPVPIGVRVVGGDHGAYQTIQARQFVVDEILGGMMVTKGFVMGNEQWSAASISQRILENSFTNYIRRFDVCLQWVAEKVQSFLELPTCKLRMKPFKKVDDIQMVQLVLQMARENRVSWAEALERMDIDAKQQLKKIEEEAAGYLKVMMDQLVAQSTIGARSAMYTEQAQNDVEGSKELRETQRQKRLAASGIAAGGQQGMLGDGSGAGEGGDPVPVDEAAGKMAPANKPKGEGKAQAAGDQGQARGGGVAGGSAPGAGAAAQSQDIDSSATEDPDAPPQVNPTRIHMDKQVDTWARELLQLAPEERNAMLERMKGDPQILDAVVGRAKDILSRQQAQELLNNEKSPEDIAQRLFMLPPKQMMAVQQAMRKLHPQMAMMVMRAQAQLNQNMLNGGMGVGGSPNGGSGQNSKGMSSDGVDMRALPSQKPPRRTNSSV